MRFWETFGANEEPPVLSLVVQDSDGELHAWPYTSFVHCFLGDKGYLALNMTTHKVQVVVPTTAIMDHAKSMTEQGKKEEHLGQALLMDIASGRAARIYPVPEMGVRIIVIEVADD